MSTPSRSHLVRTVTQDKNGRMVTRWVNPNKDANDYGEHRRMVKEELDRFGGNIPPGSGRIHESVVEYQFLRAEVREMDNADAYLRGQLRERLGSEQSLDFEDFEGDAAVVKVGKSSKMFDESAASKELTSAEFRDCRSDNLVASKLQERYPEVYDQTFYTLSDDDPQIQIDTKDDAHNKDQAKKKVWRQIQFITGKNKVDEMDNKEIATALSAMEVKRRRLEAQTSEMKQEFQEDFSHGDTYLGDVRVRKFQPRRTDWNKAQQLLGDKIEACRSDKILATKVRQVKGEDWYQKFRTKNKAAPVSVKWY